MALIGTITKPNYTENLETGKIYYQLSDVVNKIWDKVSFWKRSSDVYFNNGLSAQVALGSIDQITNSLTSNSSRLAATSYAVKQLQDQINLL